MTRSKWLDWQPGDEIIEKATPAHPTKPTKLPAMPSSVGFEGTTLQESSIKRDPFRARATWPSESLEAEYKFGAPSARLFPFIGRKVRTPQGPGVLLQVFRERCAVVLDSEAVQRMQFVKPDEIEPVSWLVGDEDLCPERSDIEGPPGRNQQ
jgi:hypothetical protein